MDSQAAPTLVRRIANLPESSKSMAAPVYLGGLPHCRRATSSMQVVLNPRDFSGVRPDRSHQPLRFQPGPDRLATMRLRLAQLIQGQFAEARRLKVPGNGPAQGGPSLRHRPAALSDVPGQSGLELVQWMHPVTDGEIPVHFSRPQPSGPLRRTRGPEGRIDRYCTNPGPWPLCTPALL